MHPGSPNSVIRRLVSLCDLTNNKTSQSGHSSDDLLHTEPLIGVRATIEQHLMKVVPSPNRPGKRPKSSAVHLNS
jgi:hypothetical protein